MNPGIKRYARLKAAYLARGIKSKPYKIVRHEVGHSEAVIKLDDVGVLSVHAHYTVKQDNPIDYPYAYLFPTGFVAVLINRARIGNWEKQLVRHFTGGDFTVNTRSGNAYNTRYWLEPAIHSKYVCDLKTYKFWIASDPESLVAMTDDAGVKQLYERARDEGFPIAGEVIISPYGIVGGRDPILRRVWDAEKRAPYLRMVKTLKNQTEFRALLGAFSSLTEEEAKMPVMLAELKARIAASNADEHKVYRMLFVAAMRDWRIAKAIKMQHPDAKEVLAAKMLEVLEGCLEAIRLKSGAVTYV